MTSVTIDTDTLVDALRADTTTTDESAERDGRGRFVKAVEPGVFTRLRDQALPWYVMGGIGAAGLAGASASAIAGADHTGAVTATVAAGCAVAGAGTGWLFRRAKKTIRWPWAITAGAAATGWISTVTATGLDWNSLAALMAGGAVLALPYWRDKRIANPDLAGKFVDELIDDGVLDEPVDLPDPVETDTDRIAADWADYLAADGCALKNSYLTDREEIDAGVRYTAMLVRGKQTWGTVQANQELIASAVDMTSDAVVVEAGATAARATVTFVERSPVIDAPAYSGPSYDTESGTVDIGLFIDGEGTPRWRVYTKNSAWGGFICGGTGMGKSRLMEILGMSLMDSGHTVVWYGDPQLGTSSSGLSEHADWAVRGTDGIATMLRVVQRVIDYRQAENAAEGWDGFDPVAQNRPGLCVIIDESHLALADKEVMAIVENIVRVARKLGIFIILASQVATLDAFGGAGSSADAIRANICAGNAAAFKTDSNNTKVAIADLEVDPTKLPAVPGYTYLIDKSGNGRTAPLRTHQLPDDGETMAQMWREAACRQATLDPGAAHVAGNVYTRRHETAAADLAKLKAYVDRVRAGADASNPLAPKPESPKPAFGNGQPARPGQAVAWPLFQLPQRHTAATTTTLPDPDRLTDSQRTLLRAIAAGATTPAQQEQATGWVEKHCRNLRNQLMATGHIEKAGHGQYRTTNRAATAA